MPDEIVYSNRYEDVNYVYREVFLPEEVVNKLPKPLRLLTEEEWRDLGVQQSQGWIHYLIYPSEPNVLLFRRPKGT